MLMAPDTPHNKPLSVQAEKLFEALKALGAGWHSRAELARQVGKTRLNPFDIALLEVLRESGLIEAEQHPASGPITYKWMYRIRG